MPMLLQTLGKHGRSKVKNGMSQMNSGTKKQTSIYEKHLWTSIYEKHLLTICRMLACLIQRMLFVRCRCATFRSGRNATNSFIFETMPYRRVPCNFGTGFTNGRGDQNLNRVCRLAVLRSVCNTFRSSLSRSHKLKNCMTRRPTHPCHFSQWVLRIKPFLFSLTHWYGYKKAAWGMAFLFYEKRDHNRANCKFFVLDALLLVVWAHTLTSSFTNRLND